MAHSSNSKFKSLLNSFLPEGRLPQLILASAILGMLIGGLVFLYDYVVERQMLPFLFGLPLVWQAVLPVFGLGLAALILRYVGNSETTPATSDEFIRQFHESNPKFPLRDLGAKLMAGLSTIGFGGAVGLEGPSIYLGASAATNLSRPVKWFRKAERRVLMVAGAAAGVAAIFTAPATGVMFALESPYREDTSRRALLPALIAAAFSFLIFAIVSDTNAIFASLGSSEASPITALNLLGGAAIGIAAGLAGRSFAWLVSWSKAFRNKARLHYRLLIGGLILGGLVVLTDWLFNSPLSLGPGTEAAHWAIEDGLTKGLGLIALLFAIRICATLTTIGMNGTGGLFIPLASLGIIMGSFIGHLIGQPDSTLYPILGMAAFLGAGYRVPFAAVVFVAETTFGSPFIVHALIASALSQVVAGSASVAAFQKVGRMGHLESRLTLPITSALTTDVLSVPTDASVREFVYQHVLGNRKTEVPVTENGIYKGMCTWAAASEIEQDLWDKTKVQDVYDKQYPTAKPTWTLHDVIVLLEKAGTETIAVVDNEDSLIGVIYEADIIKLQDLLDETGN